LSKAVTRAQSEAFRDERPSDAQLSVVHRRIDQQLRERVALRVAAAQPKQRLARSTR
jgi:hypothetical protein